MGLKNRLIDIYSKYYKVWLILTLLLIPLSFGVLIYNKAATGEYINKGVSLKGGITATFPVHSEVSAAELNRHLSKENPGSDFNVRAVKEFGTTTSIIVEASDIDEARLLESIGSFGIDLAKEDYSVENMGGALGSSFFRQVMTAVIISFILMAIVVFIVFRNPATSFFVVLAAFSDILGTLAVVTLLGVKLSTAGISAFLMLIGYSVDTDILLTTRVTKRKEGTIVDRTVGAMRTGLLMSFTSFVATLMALIFTQSEVIRQIMLILTIGLVFDVANTWLQNASILRLYLEWKEKRRQKKIAETYEAENE